MAVHPHKISGQRVAVIINGDYRDQKHRDNVDISSKALRQEGYDVDNIYAKNGSSADAFAAFHRLSKRGLKKGDEIVIYFTGHGDLNKATDEPGVVLFDRTVYASEFVEDLKGLGCEVTIVMDQCYSGNFAGRFADAPNVRFMALSGKDLTDNCPTFAQRLWNPAAEADDNKDGQISWQERFDYATDDSGIPEYSMAVYFAGAEVEEKVFNKDVLTLGTAAEFEAELAKLEFGQHAVVLFSSPSCGPCQIYKPLFNAESDGHYKFIIVETEALDEFEKFGIGNTTPEVRVYGKELPTKGVSLDSMAAGVLNEVVPDFLIKREPLEVAKGWLKNGTLEQQKAAVRIINELLTDKQEKLAFLNGILTDAHFSNDVKMEAISILGDLVKDKNQDAKIILENLVGDANIPFELRARAAAEIKIQFKKESDPIVDQVLFEALTKHYYDLDDFTAAVAARSAPADDVVVLGLAKRVFRDHGPSGLLQGFIFNDDILKIFADEAKEIALDEDVDIYDRAYILLSDDVAWNNKERAKAAKNLLLSKDVPLLFMDRFDLVYNQRITALIGDTMTSFDRSELAVKVYQRHLKSDGTLPREIVHFLMSHYNSKLASKQDNERVVKALIKTIDYGEPAARNASIEYIWNLEFNGDVRFFEHLMSKDTPFEVRRQAIMTVFPWDSRFKKAISKIAADETENFEIRRIAADKLQNHKDVLPPN